MGITSTIYKILRIRNDLNAIHNGKIGKRIQRRALGKIASKIIRKVVR